MRYKRVSNKAQKNVQITSQNINAPKLTNNRQEDEIYPKKIELMSKPISLSADLQLKSPPFRMKNKM